MAEDQSKFPFKTLIWALFALIAIFLFRSEIKGLLSDAEGVSVFGVEITASREKVNKLKDSIEHFEATIGALSTQLTAQQDRINDLDKLKSKLQKDLDDCPEAKITSAQFGKQVNQIFSTNKELKIKSDRIINSSILKLSTYTVNLVLPSNMIGADIFVDGNKANIIKSSGVYVLVKVITKSNSHNFEIIKGKNKCSVNRLITKDAQKIPILCDF